MGNDRELLHMLTMDTGKSQKGHGEHQENIQLPETEGNLRLGFPTKHSTYKRTSLGEQGLSAFLPFPGQNSVGQGTAEDTGWGGEDFFMVEGQDFCSKPMGTALCSQKSKPLASTQVLATQMEPRRDSGLAAFKANQFHDVTQV